MPLTALPRNEALARLGVDVITLSFEATANGAVQSIPDAKLSANHFKANRDRIDCLVICLPDFGDEIAIAELVSRAKLNVPTLLQASKIEVDKNPHNLLTHPPDIPNGTLMANGCIIRATTKGEWFWRICCIAGWVWR